ncbi:MAG: S8 family serine peptidase, partial [Acutalibacteraceae bacterium]
SFLVSHEAFSTAPENPKYSAEDIKTIIENADLNINETIPTDTLYISEKIPFGYDYADDDNELYNSPDDDHGTHVAGIAAGNNGKDGSEQFHGAAYDAQLYLMKCESDDFEGLYDNIVVKAIDDSIILGADCINMSFGHSKGYSEEMDNLYAEYMRKGNEYGIVFSCAAGNDGYMGYVENIPVNAENTDYGTVHHSSVIKEAMSVANALNNGGIVSTLNINDTTVDFFSANNYDFAANAPESAEYIYIGGIGEESDYTDKDVSGKFVVTNRGIIPFADKMQTAYSHGAIGILTIDNNPSGTLLPSFGDNVVIPAAALPYSTKAYFEEHPTGTISNVQSYYGEIKKSGIAPDSSYGCTPELNLKPEIAAVGTNVYSANVKNENGYIAFSGTSMATPYITGIAAIIKQYIKENKTGYFDTVSTDTLTNLVSNLMMSTANPIPYNDTVYYSPRVEGAGMVNAANALNTKAYLSMSSDGTQKAKAELGDNVDGSYSFDFYIVNMSADTLTYTPSVTVQTDGYILKDGKTYNSTTPVNIDDHITVTWSDENITVNAHESKKVTVNLSVDKDFSEEYKTYFTNGFFVEGFVTLNSPNETGLTLPFMGYDGDWLDAPLFDNT